MLPAHGMPRRDMCAHTHTHAYTHKHTHTHAHAHTHKGTHAGTYSHQRQEEGPKDAEPCGEKKLVEHVGFLPYAKQPLRRAVGVRGWSLRVMVIRVSANLSRACLVKGRPCPPPGLAPVSQMAF